MASLNVAAIIPARGGSKRLPRKNMFLLKGKPLLAYAIEACQRSTYINRVYVSSEDREILEAAAKYGAVSLERPAQLAEDAVPKLEVVRHAVGHPRLLQDGLPDLVVVPQPNSPQMRPEDIDRGIGLLLKFRLWEVMSADDNGVQNAAFRIVRTEHLFNTFLSAHCGFVVTSDCLDVHTLEDIHTLEQTMSATGTDL